MTKITTFTNETIIEKINQMKHLLINEAYFITSSVNDKKNFSTAVPFKKVKVHTIFLAQ